MRNWFAALDLLAPGVAVRNAGNQLDAERRAMAEVDSVVGRLRRHAEAARPAA